MLTARLCIPAPLWVSYKKETPRRLQVAYNDCLRILFKKPRSSSAMKLFCDSGLRTLPALLRNLMFKFMSRLDESQNYIIMMLTSPRCSSVRYQSHLWTYWYGCLLRREFVLMCLYVCICCCCGCMSYLLGLEPVIK